MIDNIILNKIGIIRTCLKRISEEYKGQEKEIDYNYTKQDSVILNLQRACEAAIDLGTRLIRLKKLGIPQNSKDVFITLETNHVISTKISHNMQAMVGFRNIAVHDYQKLNLSIVHSILENNLNHFEEFIQEIQKSLT